MAAIATVPLLLAGCAADAPSAPPGPAVGSSISTGDVNVDCDHEIGHAPPDDAEEVIADAVALVDADAVLHPTPVEGVDGTAFDGDWIWAKDGVTVRGGVKVELSVPDALEGSLLIGWGAPAEPATRVVLHCDGESEWWSFSGGYWAAQPGCHTVEVRVAGGDVHVVGIPVGVGC